jgi:hypothetical protein
MKTFRVLCQLPRVIRLLMKLAFSAQIGVDWVGRMVELSREAQDILGIEVQ